ncbi:hypothetical protein [Vibrio alginolyticus]|uniref:hypothetical protein n=1 Tax=Vibrio alginolyticus TaxID=663 RepID=UPI0038459FE4|nr:hypothetical protein [Vibrio parahaemolyticus]
MDKILGRDEHELETRQALIDVNNFIAQEAYRLAVIKQYPEDYTRIVNLCRMFKRQLFDVFGYDHDLISHISNQLLDLIILRAEVSVFRKRLQSILLDHLESYPSDVKQELREITSNFFKQNRLFQCSIDHRYPPSVLGESFHYDDVLDYYVNLLYISTEKDNCITHYQRPFNAILPYTSRRVDTIEFEYFQKDVPPTSLVRRIYEGQKCEEISLDRMFWENFYKIKWYLPTKEVNLAAQLNFQLDLSRPITNEELDQILARLRVQICRAQSENSTARMILAETKETLNEAGRAPSLSLPEYTDMAELHKVPVLGLETHKHAKDILCGLIVIEDHYVRTKKKGDTVKVYWKPNPDGCSLLQRQGLLATKLVKKYGGMVVNSKVVKEDGQIDYAGFSPAMIERGRKKLNTLIREHIDYFQKGRVLFDKRLTEHQRNKLSVREDITPENWHDLDRKKVNEVINKHHLKGRTASVKPWDNGAYIISW